MNGVIFVLFAFLLCEPIHSITSSVIFRAVSPDNNNQFIVQSILSPDTNLVTCTLTPILGLPPFNNYQGSYDPVTHSYCFLTSPNPVYIFSLNSNKTHVIQDQGITYYSVTTHNGFAYILNMELLTQDNTRVDIVNISDMTTTHTMIASGQDLITFLLMHPLLYLNDLLYQEIAKTYSATRFNQMISINTTIAHNFDTSINWIPGWVTLSHNPRCPDTIYGVQKNTLYSVNIKTGVLSPIVSRTCSGFPDIRYEFAQYTIDWQNNVIIALDSCNDPTIQIYNFNGELIWNITTWDISCRAVIGPGYEFFGIQVIVDQGKVDIDNTTCPSGQFSKVEQKQIVPYDLFTDLNFLITVGAGAGVILMLLIFGGIYIHNLRKESSTGYSKFVEGRTYQSNSPTTPGLQEILTASGGQIDANEIEIKDIIGQGSFANVYRGKLHETDVAVKIIKCISMKDMEKSLMEEASLMVTLRHPYIVLFMGACIKTPDLFIVTEFMSNGSVRELLDRKEILIEPEHVRKFAVDSCKGMAYLHSRKILHRDLKTHNLLVDGNFNVKVADFGLSRSMVDQDATMTACGTPSWAAPEVLRRDHYTHKADIYSFGICMW